ncbi:hypothetical protein GCM10028803_13880 [Larkinella knui]
MDRKQGLTIAPCFHTTSPKNEKNEGQHNKVEWRVGSLSTGKMKDNGTQLKHSASQCGPYRQPRLNTGKRRQNEADAATQIEHARYTQQVRILSRPGPQSGDRRNWRNQLENSRADEKDCKQCLSNPEDNVKRF